MQETIFTVNDRVRMNVGMWHLRFLNYTQVGMSFLARCPQRDAPSTHNPFQRLKGSSLPLLHDNNQQKKVTTQGPGTMWIIWRLCSLIFRLCTIYWALALGPMLGYFTYFKFSQLTCKGFLSSTWHLRAHNAPRRREAELTLIIR